MVPVEYIHSVLLAYSFCVHFTKVNKLPYDKEKFSRGASGTSKKFPGWSPKFFQGFLCYEGWFKFFSKSPLFWPKNNVFQNIYKVLNNVLSSPDIFQNFGKK